LVVVLVVEETIIQQLKTAGLEQVEQDKPLILVVLEPQVKVLLVVQDKM